MKRYIEQEAVIRLIKTEGFNEKYDLGHPKDNNWFCEEVNRIPAADVVEVQHGRWINIVHAIVDTTGYCDKCHSQSVWRTRDMAYEICPRCGASMDGGADDAE